MEPTGRVGVVTIKKTIASDDSLFLGRNNKTTEPGDVTDTPTLPSVPFTTKAHYVFLLGP